MDASWKLQESSHQTFHRSTCRVVESRNIRGSSVRLLNESSLVNEVFTSDGAVDMEPHTLSKNFSMDPEISRKLFMNSNPMFTNGSKMDIMDNFRMGERLRQLDLSNRVPKVTSQETNQHLFQWTSSCSSSSATCNQSFSMGGNGRISHSLSSGFVSNWHKSDEHEAAGDKFSNAAFVPSFMPTLPPDLGPNFQFSFANADRTMKSSNGVTKMQKSFMNVSCHASTHIHSDDKRDMLYNLDSYGASESESDEEDDFGRIESLHYAPKPAIEFPARFAIEDRATREPSEAGDSSIANCDSESCFTLDSTKDLSGSPQTPEHKRCFKVASELLTTERTYVKILHLIDQVFYFEVDRENRLQQMFPPDVLKKMFCNIKSLYKLHNEHLLPKLEVRLKEWATNSRIGDIMKDFAPFLKMYSEYVQNFDESINLIAIYKEKCPRFSNIIDEVQKQKECGNLPITHHLIAPIQRIPRYRLLLEAYLRGLSEDSDDRKDTEKALQSVSNAANHANEAMRTIDGFRKLLEIQENVKGVVDLVSPTRIVLKEGKITKISARTGDHQERYMFLLSDLILLCSSRTKANRMISNAPYALRAMLDVATIMVHEGDDLEIANTFYIQDNLKKIELYTQTPYEKADWMKAIYQSKDELLKRKSSLKLSPKMVDSATGLLKKSKNDNHSKCAECNVSFGVTKWKKQCFKCNNLVCSKCSENRKLSENDKKIRRVCSGCLKNMDDRDSVSTTLSSSSDILEKVIGILDVPADEPGIISGMLKLRLKGKKEWVQRWVVLRKDYVLYCYTTEKDLKAQTACPIPGITIQSLEELPSSESSGISSQDRPKCFRLTHESGKKHFIFSAYKKQDAREWIKCLQESARLKLEDSNTN